MRGGRLLLVLLLGCGESQERMLPIPIPLASRDGLLYAYGAPVPRPGGACEEETAGARPAGGLLIDVGSPLTVFRGGSGEALRHPDSHLLVYESRDSAGSGPGPARAMLCGVPLLQVSQGPEQFRLMWGPGRRLEPLMVLGGDLLYRQRLSLLLSFAREPSEPLCLRPPCLRLSRGDIATRCQLAEHAEADFPFTLVGGNQVVEFGDDLLSYPATRITLSACLEPAADPFAGPGPAPPCVSCALIAQRREATKDPCRLAQLQELERLLCRGAGACPDLDAPLGPSDCPVRPSAADLIEEEALREAPYVAQGTDVRLLLSTALPGLVLSRTAFARLRPDAERRLREAPQVALQLPGLPPETASQVELGVDRPALALVSRERFLSPCGELARSRRQRSGLPRRPGCAPSCPQAACLVNLERETALRQDRCAYSGANAYLACDEGRAPVAAVVELDGPLTEVLVVPDAAPILAAVNADLFNTSPLIDGILGVALLSRLQLEIDYPQGRVAAHCRCGAAGCRAYRRFTYHDADDCDPATEMCLPDEPVPGRIAAAACLN